MILLAGKTFSPHVLEIARAFPALFKFPASPQKFYAPVRKAFLDNKYMVR
jgi:hypothetical protein